MNISNIQSYIPNGNLVVKQPASGSEGSEILSGDIKVPGSQPVELKLPGSKKSENNSDKSEKGKSWEELVMKPSPISLEERLEQVISAEQVKDLLSLITRFPIKDQESKHNLDVKR
jgi:hypothetical protein